MLISSLLLPAGFLPRGTLSKLKQPPQIIKGSKTRNIIPSSRLQLEFLSNRDLPICASEHHSTMFRPEATHQDQVAEMLIGWILADLEFAFCVDCELQPVPPGQRP